MGYGAYMRQLLQPLGIYRFEEGNLNHSETEAIGCGLDQIEGTLDTAEKEGRLASAEEMLGEWMRLFTHPPAAEDVEALRRAIAALLLIGEGSFTLETINETLCGCGVSCIVEETEVYGTVRVSFPDTMGVPDHFGQKKTIIEEILPCHLAIDYIFRFLTWAICESKGYTWASVEAKGHSWDSFQAAMD